MRDARAGRKDVDGDRARLGAVGGGNRAGLDGSRRDGRHPGLTGISCPSASLCIAADAAGETVSTARPTGQAANWKVIEINPGFTINGISCPSPSFCAAAGSDYVATTTQPTGGPRAWALADLELTSQDNNGATVLDTLTAIGCAPSTLCLATRFAHGADNLEVSHDAPRSTTSAM
jgi:hypothetical protein